MPVKKKEAPVKCGAVLQKDVNGIVDWRNLISQKHILLNRKKFADIGIRVEALSKEETNHYKNTVEPEFLMISLAGFRELAKKRGYDACSTNLVYCDADMYVFRTTLHFLPNDEEPNGVLFDGIGGANLSNVNVAFAPYLPAIAENRAFVRAVRNYFGIETLGWDEVKTDGEVKVNDAIPFGPHVTLKGKMDSKGVDFEGLKTLTANSDKIEWQESWKTLEDLSPGACFVILTNFFANE